MSEIRIAHFQHHWEGEFARGFLEEAGVPSRLVSDHAAGGSPYLGSMAGASLLVPEEATERAREVLEAAGVLGTREEARPALLERPLPPVLRADAADLTEQLRKARKSEVRHGVFTLMGVTPAAVVPLVGLALEGNVALVALLCVLVVFVEGWQWIKAGREVARLEAALAELEEEADTL